MHLVLCVVPFRTKFLPNVARSFDQQVWVVCSKAGKLLALEIGEDLELYSILRRFDPVSTDFELATGLVRFVW